MFLKNIFSISIIPSKPVFSIRHDIRKVLKQLNVRIVEIQGGFRCSAGLDKIIETGLVNPPFNGIMDEITPKQGNCEIFAIFIVKMPLKILTRDSFRGSWTSLGSTGQIVQAIRLSL